MNQIQEAAAALVAAIEESGEYKRYQAAKKKILSYPVLKEKADEFCRQKLELQNSGKDPLEEGDRIKLEYEAVLSNPVVRDYLAAENSFCRILRQVNWQLLERLEFEADFEH